MHGSIGRSCVNRLTLARLRRYLPRKIILAFVRLACSLSDASSNPWAKTYERFRRAVISGRLLRVTGRLQRDAGVVHVVAETIEDLSPMLDQLLRSDFRHDGTRAGDQP